MDGQNTPPGYHDITPYPYVNRVSSRPSENVGHCSAWRSPSKVGDSLARIGDPARRKGSGRPERVRADQDLAHRRGRPPKAVEAHWDPEPLVRQHAGRAQGHVELPDATAALQKRPMCG